jgi:hypothetical protein
MKRYFLRKCVTAAASVVVVWNLASSPAAAQTKNTKQYAPPALPSGPSKPTPRTADGHPDLSGMWIEKYGELGEDIAFRKPTPAQASTTTKYPADALPYQPWAAKKARELFDAATTDPLLHCLPYGEPRIWGGPHPAQIIQLPGQMAILYERDTTYRVFPTDGRPHPEDLDPSWMGDSAGHWEGDTLVVDVIGFNDKSWLGSGKNAGEGSGTFHSDSLHVIERIRRPDFNHLIVEITEEDPKVFTKPWIVTWNMNLVPNERMYEDVTCSNEKDLIHQVPKNSATK